MWKKTLLVLALGAFAAGSFAGCAKKEKTTGEKLGEAVDKASDKVKEGVDKAADEANKKLDEK